MSLAERASAILSHAAGNVLAKKRDFCLQVLQDNLHRRLKCSAEAWVLSLYGEKSPLIEL